MRQNTPHPRDLKAKAQKLFGPKEQSSVELRSIEVSHLIDQDNYGKLKEVPARSESEGSSEESSGTVSDEVSNYSFISIIRFESI